MTANIKIHPQLNPHTKTTIKYQYDKPQHLHSPQPIVSKNMSSGLVKAGRELKCMSVTENIYYNYDNILYIDLDTEQTTTLNDKFGLLFEQKSQNETSSCSPSFKAAFLIINIKAGVMAKHSLQLSSPLGFYENSPTGVSWQRH